MGPMMAGQHETLAAKVFQRRLGHLSGKPFDEIRDLLRSVFT